MEREYCLLIEDLWRFFYPKEGIFHTTRIRNRFSINKDLYEEMERKNFFSIFRRVAEVLSIFTWPSDMFLFIKLTRNYFFSQYRQTTKLHKSWTSFTKRWLSQIDGSLCMEELFLPALLGLQIFVCLFKGPEIMCLFSKPQEGSISIKDHRFSVNKRPQKPLSKLGGSICIEGLENFYHIFQVFRFVSL